MRDAWHSRLGGLFGRWGRALVEPEVSSNPSVQQAGGRKAAHPAQARRRRPGCRTTRSTLTSSLEPSLDLLVELLAKRKGKKVTRAEAGAFFGLLAGTLQLARTTPDRAESAAILDAGIRAALQLAK